ncbi:NUDIX domain-containing protein [Phytoactinopolyspora mesophila]|uniref:NUDIX domain-containing protein n=1 Tax=Phytoactinopolyspora mesophila TaxID=2650750 RepID=A0A7K3LX90_9ACTN|nr:NUDIX domain-containing protein [Phytoactinopolyspora mesophila]NDL55644.1 NUDIX domain-containing protein [Phytoactinopolyspora mesophila]
MNHIRHRTDGDGWVECVCGQRHWGLYGSAGLMVVDPAHGVLLQHRAEWSHHGGTWGIPGGARASDENALAGAKREAEEEAAIPAEHVQPTHAWVEDHGSWSYTTVIATCDVPFDPYPSDPESLDIAWVAPDDVDTLPLHPAFGKLWPSIREQAFRELVLVVDAANVVGSRPDGWWRDRAGAAEKLRDRLSGAQPVPGAQLGLPATYWWPRIHLVVEGQARNIDAAAAAPVPVTVERAPGSGDDLIAAVVQDAVMRRPGDHVVVVTSDRELRGRVEDNGASTVGPRTLDQLLDP